jgi:hypothetical protein
MATVEDLIKKLTLLPKLVKTSANMAIDKNKEDIVDLNKAQMLVLGVDADGDQLGEYAPLSVEIRDDAGLQTDYIDLRFTGKFQDSMNIKKKDKGFELIATDGKWDGNSISPTLKERWPDALGLIPDNENKVTNIITGNIDRAVSKFLNPSTPARANVTA